MRWRVGGGSAQTFVTAQLGESCQPTEAKRIERGIWVNHFWPFPCADVYSISRTDDIKIYSHTKSDFMLDRLDREILAALIADARTAISAIAKNLDVAPATVHQRVRRLNERGVIRGSRLLVDWEELGLPVVAVVSLALDQAGNMRQAADHLARIGHVQSCFAITGEFDLMLVVRAESSEHLGEILQEIRSTVAGRSRTNVVLSTYYDGRIPPFPDDG